MSPRFVVGAAHYNDVNEPPPEIAPMAKKKEVRKKFAYDVSFSFAGEDRAYVERVAEVLRDKGVRVFYDTDEQSELWGKDLYAHLDHIYQNAAKYCVMFASKHYSRKFWTNHERKSAQARAFREHKEYILPARFDKTAIPGLPDTVGYIDLSKTSPDELATLIIRKVGLRQLSRFFPNDPVGLYEELELVNRGEIDDAREKARTFFDALLRMTKEERNVLFCVLVYGCPSELPENVHIDQDLLRRETGIPISRLRRILSGLHSLGFTLTERPGMDSGHSGSLFVLDYFARNTGCAGPATHIAAAVISVTAAKYCDCHTLPSLHRLNFAALGKPLDLKGPKVPIPHSPHTPR